MLVKTLRNHAIFDHISLLGYESSFTERQRVSAPRTSFFTLSAADHWGWALCIGGLVGHRRYEMRMLFDDESLKYVRNCSYYIEPVDNCTQPKYVPVKEVPRNVTKKPKGEYYGEHWLIPKVT